MLISGALSTYPLFSRTMNKESNKLLMTAHRHPRR